MQNQIKEKNMRELASYQAELRKRPKLRYLFFELTDKCKWEWKGAGYGITGPNGNTIYLPGDGYTLYDEVRGVGTYGGYWSSTCYDSDFAWYMCFGPGFIYTDYYKRNNGRSVRLVK